MTEKKYQEIDYSAILTAGPLYVDPKYKEPGFRYLLPCNRPGEIEYYKRLGYEVVTDTSGEDVITGTGKPSASTALGSAVTINSKCGAVHILMRIPEELYQKFEQYKREKNNQTLSAVGHVDGVAPNSITGAVTMNGRKL